MNEQRLTQWLVEGYPQFKANSGIPGWLLPERSFNSFVAGLGTTKMLASVCNIDLLSDELKDIPEDQSLPIIDWRRAILEWPHLSMVNSVTMALFESVNRLMEKHNRNTLGIELQNIFRALMILAFSPFIPQKEAVLDDIATILGGNSADPADLIQKYTDVALNNNRDTTDKVNECITNHKALLGWTDLIQQQMLAFQGNYRLVMVTPPFSEGLADILVEMIKESSKYGT